MAITVPKDGDVISASTFGIPVANAINALGLVYVSSASDVNIASTSFVVVRSISLTLTASRNYAVLVQSINTWIANGGGGQAWDIALFVDGVQTDTYLVVDSALSGGYIPQPFFRYRYKPTTTGNKLLTLQIRRTTAATTGNMQARFMMSIVDEGANF